MESSPLSHLRSPEWIDYHLQFLSLVNHKRCSVDKREYFKIIAIQAYRHIHIHFNDHTHLLYILNIILLHISFLSPETCLYSKFSQEGLLSLSASAFKILTDTVKLPLVETVLFLYSHQEFTSTCFLTVSSQLY